LKEDNGAVRPLSTESFFSAARGILKIEKDSYSGKPSLDRTGSVWGSLNPFSGEQDNLSFIDLWSRHWGPLYFSNLAEEEFIFRRQ
jgi:hypothetical protein